MGLASKNYIRLIRFKDLMELKVFVMAYKAAKVYYAQLDCVWSPRPRMIRRILRCGST